MDLMSKSKAVKLRSHQDKYLVANDDRSSIRQSRNCVTHRSIWLVEQSPYPGAVRLRNSSTGLFLAATEVVAFLMTGKRVIQSPLYINNNKIKSVMFDWEPIRDGFQVKLKARGGEGKFLRANTGPPPWNNSVTHDAPAAGTTKFWTLWDVDPVVDPPPEASQWAATDLPSDDEFMTSCPYSPRLSINKSAMDLFTNAKAVRLRSHHDKYLSAEEDEEGVTQDRNASSRNARWSVEFVSSADTDHDRPSLIRLKSRYGKYLTASDQHYLLGMTGRKVLQSLPRRLDTSIEWEPIRDGKRVKLRTRYGNFLRANGGLPPWRNSITHDVPHRTATQEWVLWDIDIVEILETPQNITKPAPVHPHQVADSDSFGSDSPSHSQPQPDNAYKRQESNDDSIANIRGRAEGRVIYYHIAEEDGTVNEETGQGYPLTFTGNSVDELTGRLREDTGIQDIIVCTRSPLNAKLYPLRLQLPPNVVSLHVVVVPSASSQLAAF